MFRMTMNFPFRVKRILFLCAILLLFLFYQSLPTRKQNPRVSDMIVDTFHDDAIVRQWGGYELRLARSHARFEHALYAVRKHGDACDLNQLGQPQLVVQRGCQGPLCQELTCKNFLLGSSTEAYYDFAQDWMASHPAMVKSDAAVAATTRNCSALRTHTGYQMRPPTAREEGMIVAYNMIVHRNAEQVHQLLRAIYRPQNIYCIHVDAKASSDMWTAMRNIATCFPNVHLVSKPVQFTYSGNGRLQANLNCMKDHLNSSVHWDYLINVAGQAFPLKTNEEIVEILKIYNGANDIEGTYGPRVARFQFEMTWQESNLTNVAGEQEVDPAGYRTLKDPPPFNLDIIKGSVYGVFSRRFVKWILSDKVPRALLRWSRDTFSPDEYYWATLHHTFSNPHIHPPGGYAGNPNTKPWLVSFSAWEGTSELCQGKYVQGMCVFGVKDLPDLLDRHDLFATKFELDFEPLTLACLREWHDYKWRCPARFLRDYYEALPFILPRNRSYTMYGGG